MGCPSRLERFGTELWLFSPISTAVPDFPLVDYAGFLGKEIHKYASGCIVAAAQEAVYQFSGLSIVWFKSNDHFWKNCPAQESNPKPSTALVNFAF